MFEAAELGRKISKADYDAAVPQLRADLLVAQTALRSTNCPVIVILSGADGAGKGELVNRLHEWLDPRGVESNVFGAPSDEERVRPYYWRFWRTLPPRGKIGIFFGSWYTNPIIERVYGKTKNAQLDQELTRIAFFEEMLANDGTIILKFWLHLSKKQQRKRLEKLAGSAKTRWRVTPTDWKHLGLYDKFVKVSERSIRRTDTAHAPWLLIEATDSRYRELTAGRALLDALRRCTANVSAKDDGKSPQAPPLVAVTSEPSATAHEIAAEPTSAATAIVREPTILDRVDLNQQISVREYEHSLPRLQARINRLAREAHQKNLSTVVVFEGWDAAGKGGTIRRLTAAMDARNYRVISIAAPTDEERAHHYLWRFWRHIPRSGLVTVYDRSWYGRVLVERVEGFASERDWKRAYLEINDFEEQLTSHGTVVAKFWLHISRDEQLRRFREREEIEYKRYKITPEDWRNRGRWDAYNEAVNEMVARTSTHAAPWTLVSANDKKLARLTTLRTLCDTIEAAL
ncbi:MAG TPA: polyphosphate:AMP phosphotransferase [Thermoanaerobaculia bacterium]|nr:polyphosphate:AMP phosphotransferase [Thermoanaerobaculia bacterium]